MEYRIAVPSQASQLLKSLRKGKGLTQKQLGQSLGVSQRMVAKHEAEPEKIPLERLIQILSEFDVDLVIRDRKAVPIKNNSESW